MSNIFVFAPTGNIGSHVVQQLARKGIHFKAGVRDAQKGKDLKEKYGDLIEPVLINLYDPNSLDVALKGIEKIFLGVPPENGVKHVVKLSALGCENKEKFIWANEHVQSEQMLKAAGLAVTSLRPSSFHSNLFMDIATIKEQKRIYKATADAKINLINNADVAAVAVAALTTPGHENKEYYITGPDTLSFGELAALISKELGFEVTFVPIDDAELRKQAAHYLPSAEAIDAMSNLYAYFRDGYYNVHYDDLEKVTGSKGKSVQQWLHENAAAFK